jgi:hypothetical protein
VHAEAASPMGRCRYLFSRFRRNHPVDTPTAPAVVPVERVPHLRSALQASDLPDPAVALERPPKPMIRQHRNIASVG